MYRYVASVARLLLLTFTTLLPPTPSYARSAESEPNRFLYLEGPISGGTIAPLHKELAAILRADGRAPVTLVINSPGGSVIAGMSFVNLMVAVRERDIDINCYVLDVAASMAFQVLTQCTHRYALPTSFLLWHGVRTQTQAPITAASALSLAEDLRRLDDVIRMQLEGSLDMAAEDIRYHFERETLWSGLGLHDADPHFIKLMSAYPELLHRIDTAVHMAPMDMFMFGQGDDGDGALQYIWSRYQRSDYH